MNADPPTNDLPEELVVVRREMSFDPGRAMWIANLVALGVLTAWIVLDAKFPATAHVQKGQMHALAGYTITERWPQLGPRVAMLWIVLILGVISTIGIFIMLFVGAARHRGLRSWLAFTFLIAVWLTLLVSGQEIAWHGQRLRMRMDIARFDVIAESLRSDWPTADGERPGLGTFMAYPQGTPRMLLMLTSDSEPPISAVERADDGTLGFELRGDETGTWLEWHPAGSTPRAFVDGLESEYDFRRAAPLGRGWYLVRYR